MISHTIQKVFVAQHVVDFRKQLDGLLAEAYAMELNPYQGECVVFIHRSWGAVKILGGNKDGLWMVLRRFDSGVIANKFPFLVDPSFVEISKEDLINLIDEPVYRNNKNKRK